jgi:hypothetical protein
MTLQVFLPMKYTIQNYIHSQSMSKMHRNSWEHFGKVMMDVGDNFFHGWPFAGYPVPTRVNECPVIICEPLFRGAYRGFAFEQRPQNQSVVLQIMVWHLTTEYLKRSQSVSYVNNNNSLG